MRARSATDCGRQPAVAEMVEFLSMSDLTVIGGGLAGSEAAWQAADLGLQVTLYEMRPGQSTGAHRTGWLAELVCSNSLGSDLPDRAAGLLKNELRRLGSMVLACAEEAALPAGGALAVDRENFARRVTERIEAHPHITLIREEVKGLADGPCVVASGPLTSASLAAELCQLAGEEHLYFFDAISPIVSADSVNMQVAYRASRYGRGERQEGDYINCPLDADEYRAFVHELASAERIQLREFEEALELGVNAGPDRFFEGCLPVEILASRDEKALAFGPMRPVGLRDPRTGRRPHAVLQLRQDNLAGTLHNLVGFQTNLTYPEQRRVFRMVPGLERAEFLRYGQMHRNTFINSPRLLLPTLQFRERPGLLFAGQITGVEGYVGNIATGLLAGLNAARWFRGQDPLELPRTTMLGALCHYVSHADPGSFQPMKANFGLLPPLEGGDLLDRKQRAKAYVERALRDLVGLLSETQIS